MRRLKRSQVTRPGVVDEERAAAAAAAAGLVMHPSRAKRGQTTIGSSIARAGYTQTV